MAVQFEVYGKPVTVEPLARTTLADCLRHEVRLTGTHVGCEHGVCGACTVIIDGAAVRSTGGGSKDRDRRGPVEPGNTVPAASGLSQTSCLAMRLLYARNADNAARSSN